MMLRFLSVRRKGRAGTSKSISQISNFFLPNKNLLQCRVVLLDGTDISVDLSIKAVGNDLYKWVFYSLDLLEKHYFGLQYTDADNVKHWLDPMKSVKKQVKIGPPYTLFLKVKFYSSELTMLQEELTRYQFFLQLKQDIAEGRLPCSFEKAAELSALALQSELGDYYEDRHTPAVISEFKFIPDQSEEFEIAVLEEYQHCKGLKPSQAELSFLNKAIVLPNYAVQNHVVFGSDNNEYYLGLMPTGVKLLEGSDQIGVFRWPNILRLDFKKKKIKLIAVDDNGDEEHTFVFRLHSEKACKRLWKCAVEYHTFYRLHAPVKGPSSRHNLFRTGSRFFSGKTEFEHTQQNRPRRTAQFERRPSRRFARRQSHALRLTQRSRNGDGSVGTDSSVATDMDATTADDSNTLTHNMTAATDNDATAVANIGTMTAIESAAATAVDIAVAAVTDTGSELRTAAGSKATTDTDVKAMPVADVEGKTATANVTTIATGADIDTTTTDLGIPGTNTDSATTTTTPSITLPVQCKAVAVKIHQSVSNASEVRTKRQAPSPPVKPA